MSHRSEAAARLERIAERLGTIIADKQAQIQDCLTCLLAGGHLLIEDIPGVGKTTLAQALAQVFGLNFSRMQFTADLMPSDLTGVSVFERATESFNFRKGPLFAQVLLADEINRASPKTQSALLEAMEEHQVSVDGQSHRLPQPFFVIATQNPYDQQGTYQLPQSQMDRFLMRTALGYPGRLAERELLSGGGRRALVQRLEPLASPEELLQWQELAQLTHASGALLDYAQDLIAATRSGRFFAQGLSPRAGIVLLRAARARALLNRRDYVAPDDIAAIWPQTIAHRLTPAKGSGGDSLVAARAALESVVIG